MRAAVAGRNNVEEAMAGLVENVRADRRGATAEEEEVEDEAETAEKAEEEVEVMLSR